MARNSREILFTDDKIGALSLPRTGERLIYLDKGQPGLCLRVGAKSKSFFFYSRDADGKRLFVPIGRWSRAGLGGTFTVDSARRKFLDKRGEEKGRGGVTATVGELLDMFVKRSSKCSSYTAGVLKKHLEPIRDLVAADLAAVVLSDLVADVQKGREEGSRRIGGPAVADKVRGGLRSLFAWAQRQGRFPQDRALPTIGLVREDFDGIGTKERGRVPSEREVHELFDALGVGRGDRLEIDMRVNPRVSLAARLAVLLVMHVPVRSGAGILSQPARAADLDERVLRWTTRKGGRTAEIATPLSSVAVEIVKRLRELDGGEEWLVPAPENAANDVKEHIDVKVLARLFSRLQSPGAEGEAPRVTPEKGMQSFVPHTLRALWTTLAGDLGVEDGTAVRVIGHKPEGASAAHGFYDKSKRLDLQRDGVERVSAELERLRRREPRTTPLHV